MARRRYSNVSSAAQDRAFIENYNRQVSADRKVGDVVGSYNATHAAKITKVVPAAHATGPRDVIVHLDNGEEMHIGKVRDAKPEHAKVYKEQGLPRDIAKAASDRARASGSNEDHRAARIAHVNADRALSPANPNAHVERATHEKMADDHEDQSLLAEKSHTDKLKSNIEQRHAAEAKAASSEAALRVVERTGENLQKLGQGDIARAPSGAKALHAAAVKTAKLSAMVNPDSNEHIAKQHERLSTALQHEAANAQTPKLKRYYEREAADEQHRADEARAGSVPSLRNRASKAYRNMAAKHEGDGALTSTDSPALKAAYHAVASAHDSHHGRSGSVADPGPVPPGSSNRGAPSGEVPRAAVGGAAADVEATQAAIERIDRRMDRTHPANHAGMRKLSEQRDVAKAAHEKAKAALKSVPMSEMPSPSDRGGSNADLRATALSKSNEALNQSKKAHYEGDASHHNAAAEMHDEAAAAHDAAGNRSQAEKHRQLVEQHAKITSMKLANNATFNAQAADFEAKQAVARTPGATRAAADAAMAEVVKRQGSLDRAEKALMQAEPGSMQHNTLADRHRAAEQALRKAQAKGAMAVVRARDAERAAVPKETAAKVAKYKAMVLTGKRGGRFVMSSRGLKAYVGRKA